ncbi:MAG: 1-phosphofructokinase family hexose kinase [Ignavibacteriales bacterium]
MILTVTVNPLLERRYYYNKLDLSAVNRDGKLIIKAGGKGINVNRQLNKFGIPNSAMIFTGGTNGKLMREALRNEKIIFTDIQIKSETRDASIIIDESSNRTYSFFGNNPSVSSDEAESFIFKMEKAIQTCEIVVFSGSSPYSEADLIFTEGIKIANKLDKISICDTYGKHLEQYLKLSPTIVHNNVDEINLSLGLMLNDETNQIELLKTFYEYGIKQAFITDSGKAFYASNFDFHYRTTLPEIKTIDSTGSGDAFVAGIIYGWNKKLNFEEQLQFASASGICNAKSLEVCDVNIDDAFLTAKKVIVEPVGKKIKTVNDSHH